MILRCTAKVFKLLGPEVYATPGSTQAPDDDDWYVNMLWLDRRKCLLVTHVGRLFTAFSPNVGVADLRRLATFVPALIEHELSSEGLPLDTFGHLTGDDVHLEKTADRSVLGCMNDMAQVCRIAVERAGGLGNCDVGLLNHRLRRSINSPRGYALPIELAFRRVSARPAVGPVDLEWR